MSEHSYRRLSAHQWLWIGVAALVLGITFCAAVVRNNVARTRALRNSLVGTWATDGGVILQLRPDGSARVRYPSSPNEPVNNFRWEVGPSQLFFVMSPQKPRSIKEVVYGLFDPSWTGQDEVDRFEVIDVASDQADLIALPQRGSRGAEYSMHWTKAEDATFDSAP